MLRRTALSFALAVGASACLELPKLDIRIPFFGAASAVKPGYVIPLDPLDDVSSLAIEAHDDGACSAYRLVNNGHKSVRIKEVVVADLEAGFPSGTEFYGEGFTMLSQTDGSPAAPHDVGRYTDREHYKIPAPGDSRSVYGVATFAVPGRDRTLTGFASCKRFVGRIDVGASRLRVVEECDGLELGAHESWDLEPILATHAADRETLFDSLAREIEARHPRRKASASPPTGWCSWYGFGPSVTAQNVADNLDFIGKNVPGLRYVQIDDGYQPHMGDWQDSGPSFGGHVEDVLRSIRERGFEPALWVAPFVADGDSRLFHEHPDWFVMDEHGAPLRSDRVTFGGWRLGPWYALDGTNPAAQKWLEETFKSLRERWGVSYFKLDANFWGAIHGGHFHDPKATRVEAYRRGMQAILRGAGDAFVLGCNHPLWPSLGLIDGSRSSLDVDRNFDQLKGVGRESLLRNWQNGRLWWNDPDCLLLTGNLTDDEFRFHATLVFATGGMLLSGDDLSKLSPERLELLKRLVPPSGIAARFADDRFELGTIDRGATKVYALLNWGDAASERKLPIAPTAKVRDLLSGAELDAARSSTITLPPHGGALIEVK